MSELLPYEWVPEPPYEIDRLFVVSDLGRIFSIKCVGLQLTNARMIQCVDLISGETCEWAFKDYPCRSFTNFFGAYAYALKNCHKVFKAQMVRDAETGKYWGYQLIADGNQLND